MKKLKIAAVGFLIANSFSVFVMGSLSDTLEDDEVKELIGNKKKSNPERRKMGPSLSKKKMKNLKTDF